MYVACRNKHPALALFLFLLYSNVFANKLRRPFAKKKLEHGNVYDPPSKRPKNEYLARSQTPINRMNWIRWLQVYQGVYTCTTWLHGTCTHLLHEVWRSNKNISFITITLKKIWTHRDLYTYCANFFILKKNTKFYRTIPGRNVDDVYYRAHTFPVYCSTTADDAHKFIY